MKKNTSIARPKSGSSGIFKITQITGILLMAAGGILLASLVSHTPGSAYDPDTVSTYPPDDPANWAGRLGTLIAWRLLFLIGFGAYPLGLAVLVCGWCVFRGIDLSKWVFKTIAALFLIVIYCGASELAWDQPGPAAFRFGGAVGMRLAFELLRPNLGFVGSLVACVSMAIVILVLVTNIRLDKLPELVVHRFSKIFHAFSGTWSRLINKKFPKMPKAKPSIRMRAEKNQSGEGPLRDTDIPEPRSVGFEHGGVRSVEDEILETPPDRLHERPLETQSADISDIGAPGDPLESNAPPEKTGSVYDLPSIELMEDPPEGQNQAQRESLIAEAQKLETSLFNFGIEGRILQVTPGPVITSFEVEPPPGVKVNRIVTLSDDLALTMKARSIRIQAPIPGKSAVGIEIPNAEPAIVYFKEIIGSPEFQKSSSRLLLALGKTVFGDPYCADLGKMPHLLIAGATGAGKSVCINVLISSLLYKAMPDEVKLVLIDPKFLELSAYNDIPHLLTPVVTDPKKASEALKWTVGEMEERYQRLARVGVRNINDFNLRVKGLLARGRSDEYGEIPRPLPYIVVIIDELADLMMTAPADIEEALCRLAQMARAVGIHLIVATQRPSVNVVTGLIKANFPARIAFQVASKIDSRTILDSSGAEKLLGRGDMLYLPPGQPEPLRVHGAYLSTEETERMVDAIKSQGVAPETIDLTPKAEETGFDDRERDSLYDDALKLAVMHQQASASLFQRRLKVGYARAARLVDELEMTGIIGPFDGSKAREVLVDESYLEEILGAGERK